MQARTSIAILLLALGAFAQESTPAATARRPQPARPTAPVKPKPTTPQTGVGTNTKPSGPSRPARRELISRFLAQEANAPAPPQAGPPQVGPGGVPQVDVAQPLDLGGAPDLWLGGAGVQAPLQPATRSTAVYERGERFVPQPGRGASGRAITTTIQTLCDVRGQEENDIFGIGLVTGLAGTGDSPNMTRQLVDNVLRVANIRVDLNNLAPKNVAFVRVEAKLPPGIQAGRKIDVRVSTLGDAKSLQGGTLLFTELTDVGGIVYATASGPVDVGGFLAEGQGATVSKNHVTVGTIASGGKVERSVPVEIVSENGFIYLDLRPSQSSFTNLVRMCEAVNLLYPIAAEAATDGRTVKVRVPEELPRSSHVAFLESILSLEVTPEVQPYVVVNERTGTIVMGEGVRLRAGAVAMGNLTVSVAESPETSQPGPLSGGQTQQNPRTDIKVSEDSNGLVEIPGAVSLQEVVDVLNVLGLSPRELIMILDAMHQAGMLLAEVRRM
jgi:flagellar P-ring protein precursor FlgI